MIRIALIALLLPWCLCIKFTISLPAEQQRCFYQVLSTKQKYVIYTDTESKVPYRVDIKHQDDKEWKHSVTRTVDDPSQPMKLYKYASLEAVYSFCFISMGRDPLRLQIELKWGLEIMDIDVLAQESDKVSVSKQTEWIDKQTDVMLKAIESASTQRNTKIAMTDTMETKFIGFAAIGVLSILGINIYLYFSLKRTFRERKLI